MEDRLAILVDLDFFSFFFRSVPPGDILIKGLLNFVLDNLVKLFAGLKLDRLANVLADFCMGKVIIWLMIFKISITWNIPTNNSFFFF
jgi:hypothetical protein